MELVSRVCPLCGVVDSEVFLLAKDYLVSSETFALVGCKACGFKYLNPMPKSLGVYYHSEAYISHTAQARSLMQRVYLIVRSYMLKVKMRMLKQNGFQSGCLLDYGCATGHFLNIANTYSDSVLGYEPEERAADQARSKGLRVLSNFEEVKALPSQGIACITLWHVLEHVPNLHQVLDVLVEKLPHGGMLVVAVPEYQSYDALYYKQYWAAWDLPRHVNHFDRDSMQALMAKKNLHLLNIRGLFFDAFYIALMSESHKGNKRFGFLKAMGVALWSNWLGFLGKKPYSSQVYFFRKR